MSLLRTFTFVALRRSNEPATMDFSRHVLTAVDLEREARDSQPGDPNWDPAWANQTWTGQSTVRLHLHRADGIVVLAPPVVAPRGLLEALVDSEKCLIDPTGDCLVHGLTTIAGAPCPQAELRKLLDETSRP